jgi:hypothetical protein
MRGLETLGFVNLSYAWDLIFLVEGLIQTLAGSEDRVEGTPVRVCWKKKGGKKRGWLYSAEKKQSLQILGVSTPSLLRSDSTSEYLHQDIRYRQLFYFGTHFFFSRPHSTKGIDPIVYFFLHWTELTSSRYRPL